jgi:type IV secretory pathway protease TraF
VDSQRKHVFAITRAGIVAVAAVSLFAGLNYNASKSNTGNIVVHSSSVSGAQAASILREIDKASAPTEADVRGYLTKAGVKPGAIAKIVIETTDGKTTVLLLDDAGDESKARSVANITTSRSNTQHN